VTAIDSIQSVTDAPQRSLSLVAKVPINLADVLMSDDQPFCGLLDRCKAVSLFLLERAPAWLDED